jgi:High potential iron-sulfur protein
LSLQSNDGAFTMNPTPVRSNRRTFILRSVSTGAALCGGALSASASAAEKKRVEENEPRAATLGYRHDSASADKKRFPKHQASQKCNNCVAWLGKTADAWAECDLLGDRLVASPGWCSSYVKA